MTKFSEQEQELKEQNQDDSQYEFVSAETVQDVVLWVYKTSMRLQHQVHHVFSWQDARLTLKVLITVVLTFISALILGDALFLMLAVDIWLLLPLIEKKMPQ